MQHSDLPKILTELENSGDNTAEFSEDWSQGRSAFGGISAAFASTAMRKLVANDKPIRSLMVSFIAPLPAGKCKVEPSLQREGRNVSQCAASLIHDEKLCLQAMAAFGNSREGFSVDQQAKFDPLPRENGVRFDGHAKRLPNFLKFFDGAWVGGGMPFASKFQPTLKMWVKHKSDMRNFPVEKIVTIADIPPPVILTHFSKPPVPSSSLSWSLEFVVPPQEIESEWFYLEFETEAAANGYTQQSGRIFDEGGRLCALSRQCMVYFG
jgi:acyl-CoA thioesterase